MSARRRTSCFRSARRPRDGCPSSPSGPTLSWTGSIFDRVPAISLLTQTVLPSGETAIPLGPAPTVIVALTAFVAGSTRVTVPSTLFATQTAAGPTATAPAPRPTLIGWVTILARRIDAAETPVRLARHPDRTVPDRDPVRAGGNRNRVLWLSRARVDLGHGAIGRIGNPHGTLSVRDTQRPVADRDRLHRGIRLRVDPRHRPAEAVRNPDVATADGYPGRRVPDRDRVHRRVRLRIDLGDRVVVDVGRPRSRPRRPRPRSARFARTPARSASRCGRRTTPTESAETPAVAEARPPPVSRRTVVTTAPVAAIAPQASMIASRRAPARDDASSGARGFGAAAGGGGACCGLIGVGRSSEGSWRRIAVSRTWRASFGSRPSSSTSAVRACW